MIEVEIKVKIDNPDEVRTRFKTKNGVYICSLLHEDTYFNMPEGLRDFRRSDEALRIRKSTEFNRNNNRSTKETLYFLTYKGTKLNSQTKTRKELETTISNLEKEYNTLKKGKEKAMHDKLKAIEREKKSKTRDIDREIKKLEKELKALETK